MRGAVAVVVWLMLSGCTALVIGGGAAGGYQAGKNARSSSVAAADAAITTEIEGRYVADPLVSVFRIGVRTWDGTVTLSGSVGSSAARNQAGNLARGTTGVKRVNNQIVVED